MKDKVIQKIQELTKKAKEAKTDSQPKKISYGVNSLSDNIKTKEQADTFKKILKSL
jgi:phage shock protein A